MGTGEQRNDENYDAYDKEHKYRRMLWPTPTRPMRGKIKEEHWY